MIDTARLLEGAPGGFGLIMADLPWHFSANSAAKPGKGALYFGTGYILRSAHEPFLIATRGNPRFTRSTRSVIEGDVREHSRKPDEAYAAAEGLVPDVARIDLFSRQQRPGWIAWGNETDRFKE